MAIHESGVVVTDTAPNQPVVSLRGIGKRFGAVAALRGVDLDVGKAEVVGLVGDNGAGKSTLMMVLSGALHPDSGEIAIDGSPVRFSSTRDARDRGIEMLYQGLALCDDLDVADNFFLGRTPTRLGMMRRRYMHAEAQRRLTELHVRLPSTRMPVRLLSGGQRQSVAVARAVSFSPRVLILDEPTAALGVRQAAAVLDLINRVRAVGVSVIFISHRLRDVLSVCDRVVVLYEGRTAADLRSNDTSLEEVVRYIVRDPDVRGLGQD
jgi:simple sugar transport system ATP-binding protein